MIRKLRAELADMTKRCEDANKVKQHNFQMINRTIYKLHHFKGVEIIQDLLQCVARKRKGASRQAEPARHSMKLILYYRSSHLLIKNIYLINNLINLFLFDFIINHLLYNRLNIIYLLRNLLYKDAETK